MALKRTVISQGRGLSECQQASQDSRAAPSFVQELFRQVQVSQPAGSRTLSLAARILASLTELLGEKSRQGCLRSRGDTSRAVDTDGTRADTTLPERIKLGITTVINLVAVRRR